MKLKGCILCPWPLYALNESEVEMMIEYIGQLLPDEHLSLTPSVLSILPKGQPLKITIEPLHGHTGKKISANKAIDASTKRFLARLENAPELGQMKGELSREDLYEEMSDDKF
jgi:hypothetical protein